MSLDLEEVTDGLGFPEGPDGSLLFVDIKNETLSRVGVGGRVDVVAEIPGGPNGAAIGPDGAAYVCNNGGVYSFVPFGPDKVTVPMPDPDNFTGGSVQRVDHASVQFIQGQNGCSRRMTLSSTNRAGSGSPKPEFRTQKPSRRALLARRT